MKIFALNFCLDLQVWNPNQPYQFEAVSWEQLAKAMAKAEVRPGQQWYVKGASSRKFVEQVFEAQADTAWRELPFSTQLLFEDQEQLHKFLSRFRDKFKEKLAAGGIVQNEKGEFLLIYNRGCWTLPKGHVDKGETILAAAVREVKEETGLKEVVPGQAFEATYHTFWHRKKERWTLKTTHWYHMQADAAQALTPQADEHIEAVAWHSKAEWLQVAPASYPLNRYLFSKVFSQSLIS